MPAVVLGERVRFPKHYTRCNNVVELICTHGVGHPSSVGTLLLGKGTFTDVDHKHSCDGCCKDDAFLRTERKLFGRQR